MKCSSGIKYPYIEMVVVIIIICCNFRFLWALYKTFTLPSCWYFTSFLMEFARSKRIRLCCCFFSLSFVCCGWVYRSITLNVNYDNSLNWNGNCDSSKHLCAVEKFKRFYITIRLHRNKRLNWVHVRFTWRITHEIFKIVKRVVDFDFDLKIATIRLNHREHNVSMTCDGVRNRTNE